jgi:O-antigen/teichoic acid export membrane protein
VSGSTVIGHIQAKASNFLARALHGRLNRSTQFILDWLLNYSGVVFPALTALVLIPLMMRGLGSQAYGLWITAATIASLFGILDLGFGAAVVREAGIARGASVSADTQQFIQSVGNFAILLAVGCTALMTLAAIPLSKHLHLPPSLKEITPLIFFLYGITFLGDWLFDYARSVLVGLGRFGVAAFLSTSGALLRAGGIAVLLQFRSSLILMAILWASCQLLIACLALVLMARIEPLYSFRPHWPKWQCLASRAPFSFGMVLSNTLYNLIWQIPVLAISFLLGPAALVTYYIAQKLPVGLLGFVHSGGEVLYVSSSAASNSEERCADGLMLRSALRWNFLMMLPLLIVFAVLAPAVFPIWLRASPPHVVEVARIVALAAAVDFLCAPILNSLWGRGLIRTTLVALSIGTLACAATSLLLIPLYGLPGAAAALLIGSLLMVVHLVWSASRHCAISIYELMGNLCGFIIPGILCSVVALISLYYIRPVHWLSLIAATIPPGLAFFALVFGWQASRTNRKRDYIPAPGAR